MSHDSVSKRLQNLRCSDKEKKILSEYLFSCLADGKNFNLKRNRVMISENVTKNKFIILELVPTADEDKQMYICPKCSNINFCNLLTSSVPADQFKNCIHSELCNLIWGDTVNLDVDIIDDKEEDLVEIITEVPRYMAAIHPSSKSPKGPGVVVLTSKTLKPKCVVCPGQDSCIHLAIHMQQYKRGLEESNTEGNESKKLRINKIDPKRPQKKNEIDPDTLDPYQHDGAAVNVFNITIDFIQTKEGLKRNREVHDDKEPFDQKILVAKYDAEEICFHGNKYDSDESILFVESTNIMIHHTAEVESIDKKVLYRPVLHQSDTISCFCKKFYNGKDDQLIRVSPAYNKMTGRQRTLHFVSIEWCFSLLSQLVASGETMTAFIKSRKFMNEIFMGFDKTPEYKKVLQKGFEIFIHALKFPLDSNYCFDCPQTLELGQKKDDFNKEIEYSIIDGIQMGCRTQENKSEIKDEYFKEELVEDITVQGIEAKDRTFLNTKKVRNVLANLLSNASDRNALTNATERLSDMDLDENATSVLELLYRIASEHELVPECYLPFLNELRLETPISALMVPYSSDQKHMKSSWNILTTKLTFFHHQQALKSSSTSFQSSLIA